jgi:hypothetical protein
MGTILIGNTHYDYDNSCGCLHDLKRTQSKLNWGDFYPDATNQKLKTTFINSQIDINSIMLFLEAM